MSEQEQKSERTLVIIAAICAGLALWRTGFLTDLLGTKTTSTIN